MLLPCLASSQMKHEIFGGYSRMSTDFAVPGPDRAGLNGWDASIAHGMSSWFSVKADFSGHYGSSNMQIPLPITVCPPDCLPPIHVTTNTHEFLFGPQVTYRTHMVRVFAHALIGAEHVTESAKLPLPLPIPPVHASASETGFATAIGGGVDLGAGPLALRFQPDVLITHVFNRTQYEPRIGVGLVMRF
jgi:hypothetical protein